MKTRFILFVIAAALIFAACEKDKFTTIPQVKAKSISPGTVIPGNIIKFTASFTDEEGDIDTVFVVYRWYDNATIRKVDTFKYNLASFNLPPKVRDGDLIVQYAYGNPTQGFETLGAVSRDTTATLGIFVADKLGNRSELAESDRIRLLKQ